MTPQPPLETATLDAVLDSLLGHDPPPLVVALNEGGLFVPMPPSVPASLGRLFEGCASVLQLVVADDLPVVIETWERARQTGAARGDVHLLGDPSRLVNVHYVDARHRYGVLLGFIVGRSGPTDFAHRGETAIRPRVWTSRKDEFAVISDVDDAVRSILGWAREEMVGHRSLEFIHPEDRPRAIANWMDTRSAPGVGRRVRLRHLHRNGSWQWFEFTNHNLLADPNHCCVVAEMVDISDEMAALEALRANERLLRRLAEALPLGVAQSNAAGCIVYRNERLEAIIGNAEAATLDEQFADVAPADRPPLERALRDVLESGRDADLEVALQRDGAVLRCSLSLRALTAESGAVAGAIACIWDITERVRMREELEVRAKELEIRATYDALTGCHNRASILALLEVAASAPQTGSGLAVIFVDLDRFKQINDRLGHAAGDQLLRRTAQRLTAVARAGDVVGRIGGDEFLIVCRDVESERQAVRIAERIAAALCERVDVGTKTIKPRASVGVAWTQKVLDATALIAAADSAMYDSKREARGRAVLNGSPRKS
jgi:diguanylate cyclase (GGDEF)-like protein/PAS domain S-box-containing protein